MDHRRETAPLWNVLFQARVKNFGYMNEDSLKDVNLKTI